MKLDHDHKSKCVLCGKEALDAMRYCIYCMDLYKAICIWNKVQKNKEIETDDIKKIIKKIK